MAQDTDDLPPPLDDPDAMDDYWFEKTTITVDRHVKAELDHQRDGQPWNEYLSELRRIRSDPLTLNEVDAVADRLTEQLDITSDTDPDAIARAVSQQIDYAHLADSVADELEGRMR